MLRRDFIRMMGGLFAVPALTPVASFAESESKVMMAPDLVAIFSDTHINPGGYQRKAFEKRVEQLLALRPRPANLLIYGDFAYLFGKPEDYRAARESIAPVEEAGIKWHVAFGNHDRREAFFNIFPERIQAKPNVPNRFVSIVETNKVDFILLDSLDEGKVAGTIDREQREWLAAMAPKRTKPFFVGAHHDLNETKVGDIIKSAPCCAGYIHGHHHYWRPSQVDSIQSLCLPSVGHWGDIGYVLLDLSLTEALFKLQMLDYYKPKPEEPRKPEWLEEVKKKTGAEFHVPLPAAKVQMRAAS